MTGDPLTTAGEATVAVILPNWNSAGILERCLRAILDQDADLELVVVDNGSTDGSADSLRRLEAEEPRLRCHYAITTATIGCSPPRAIRRGR